MLCAETSEGMIGAIFGGLAGLLVAGVAAWTSIKKAWQELAEKKEMAAQAMRERDAALAKATRNGVIGDLEKALERCGARNDASGLEISELRAHVSKLYGLIAVKDTRVEGQAAQVEKLQTTVALQTAMMKDATPVTNLPAGTEVKIPESTMKETK